MEIYGRGYVIDHIAARLRKEAEEQKYRDYVTEALRIIGENTTHYLIPGVGAVDYGTYLKARWRDPPAPQDDRTGDEIAFDIIQRAGLTLSTREDGEDA